MGDSNSKNSKLKGIGGILLTSVAVPIADKVIEKIADRIEEQPIEENVTVPVLYTRIHLTLEQAVKSVEAVGLKAIPVEIHPQKASAKYKDCFEYQVVDSEPKQNKRVKPGTGIRLIFVTKEVIEESRKIFDAAEGRKAERKEERATARARQKEIVKQKVTDIVTKTKSKIEERK